MIFVPASHGVLNMQALVLGTFNQEKALLHECEIFAKVRLQL